MNKLSQSYRKLALYYCYVIVLNCRECNTVDQQDREKQRQHGRYAEPDEWVVRLEGGPEVASLLALRSGYAHVGPVLGFKDTYLWRAKDGFRYKKRGMPYAVNNLRSRAKILWADQQRSVRRTKRGYLDDLDPFSIEDFTPAAQPGRRKLSQRAFNDELWDQEWYLLDQGKTEAEAAQPRTIDLNVLPVYKLGVTGRGVRIAVLDDGLEYTHEDLRANYDPEISYDVTDRDEDPMPRYEEPEANGHGTRCAGEIAMEADNRKCGVGVAFEASIGGIKMLDGIVNDRIEAEALGYRVDLVDIYTASWGPPDDGKSLDTPGRLASEALERGIREGRDGRGSIYVWASGNGGSKNDDCGCDGYVGSIYTIAIGSASQTGNFPWYGEMCPANLATTYSGGAFQDQMIATTDLKNSCTTSHTGTSASAPLAAGILALALQVNKNLTWRDVQHLVIYTSKHDPLKNNPGWFRNAAGLWFNPRFGFGLMDAHSLVLASSNWTSVSEKLICQVPAAVWAVREVSYGLPLRVQFEADGCAGVANEIHYLEHVQVETNVEYTLRGALQMHLTAPSGTRVQLLGTRQLDDSTDGFIKWKFMSVATWGEDPKGTWSLDVTDEAGPMNNTGIIRDSKLILHGTQDPPFYLIETLHDCNKVLDEGDKLNYVIEDESNLLDKSEFPKNHSVFDEIVRFLLS
ncbi:neuroendocrine convertase 1 isoform X1 [Nasonia vitripennis]|uniref:furin n=2 Tax=Nasonia vitripennis TaxID=7425 RepID=A0A7M7J3U3_NASVI|nr:neuroendocrine convertase 1 isoform X1 [Nasonia vitripennis]